MVICKVFTVHVVRLRTIPSCWTEGVVRNIRMQCHFIDLGSLPFVPFVKLTKHGVV